MYFTIFLKEKMPFYAIKTKCWKSRKIDIFPKGLTPCFWCTNGQFYNFFFFGNIGQENVFYDILEQKNAFLGYKNQKLKNSKNWHFSKEVDPWFFSKMAIFPTFFNGNVGQENVFCDILERKNAFQGYKNNKFKSREINIFPKGLTHDFGPKMAIFPISFFRQYRQGKCMLRYSRRKKRLSTL